MRDWSLSEELYRAFHAWPVVLAFCLLGGLLGWVATYLWPTTYRTHAQVFVSLNPYRTFEELPFAALNKPSYTNIDDYKNWQMEQLSGAIFTDEVIRETLGTLREIDPYWNSVSANQLRDMLRAEWRTAGIWSLVAEDPTAKRSNQAVREWSRTAVKSVNLATAAARKAAQTDAAMQMLQKQRLEASQDWEQYRAADKELGDWLEQASQRPASQPVGQAERLRLTSLASSPAQFTPAWTELLAAQPPEGASTEDVIAWLREAQAAVQTEIEAVSRLQGQLEQQYTRLERQYDAENEQSLGLSPNLVIKDFEKFSPEVIRPTWLFVLLGTVIGLLAWIVFVLIKVTRRKLSA